MKISSMFATKPPDQSSSPACSAVFMVWVVKEGQARCRGSNSSAAQCSSLRTKVYSWSEKRSRT